MRRVIGLVAVLVVAFGVHPAGIAHADEPEPVWADYYGRPINLSASWEGAQACLISATGNRCFDTESELDESLEGGRPRPAGVLATCSTTLRLYDGSSFGTPVVAYDTRGVTISLGTFANKTSSYRVGACGSFLYNGSSTYPGATGAGASASSMLSGWDNTIDSIYIS